MDRALTDAERAVVEWILEGDFEDAQTYRDQVAGLRVRGTCGCGCPSIDFVAPGTALGGPLPREGWIRGESVGIALLASEGRLTGLDQTDYVGSRSTLPDPAELVDALET